MGLRAENGLIVSGKRKNGATTEVKMIATVDAVVKLKNPFAGAKADWNMTYEKEGDYCLFALKKGDELTGHRN